MPISIEHNKVLSHVYDILDNVENDDNVLPILEASAEFYCSTHDLCEGYKRALKLCLEDQYENHADEVDIIDLIKLNNILSKIYNQ